MQTNDPTIQGEDRPVNHPASEEWMDYLYGNSSRGDGARLAGHLQKCPACRARVDQWRSAMASLDEWKLPAVPRPRAAQPVLKWAVAAALVFGLGLGLSAALFPFSANGRNAAALRQEMRGELQAELRGQLEKQREQLLAQVVKVLDERRAEDSRLTLAALREMNNARQADYAALHKELETMAVLTENSLRQAQQQIINLASSPEPAEANTFR